MPGPPPPLLQTYSEELGEMWQRDLFRYHHEFQFAQYKFTPTEICTYFNSLSYTKRDIKGKVISDPITGPVWPRGWVQVQLYSYMTVALAGGEWSAAGPSRTLPPYLHKIHV